MRCGTALSVPMFLGKADELHRDNGLWACDTVNPNGWGGMLTYLEQSVAEITIGQEARVVDEGDDIVRAQRAVHQCSNAKC